MNEKLKKDISSGKAVDRVEVLMLLQAALRASEPNFVRLLAEDWLNAYPYDLPVELIRAQAYFKNGTAEKAIKIAARLVELDPEYVEAQDLLASTARRVKPQLAEQARAASATLRRSGQVPEGIQPWAQSLVHAQLAIEHNDLQKAQSEVQAALLSNPPSPLPAMAHLHLARVQGDSWHAIHNLIKLYRGLWPHCLQLRLMDAQQLMESGQEDEALDILHDCVAEDVSGQVARRLWGQPHRFSAIWPGALQHVITLPIPAAVAAALSWNHLASKVQEKTVQETVAPEVHIEVKMIEVDPAASVAEIKAVVAEPAVEVDDQKGEEAEAVATPNPELPSLKRPRMKRVPRRRKQTEAYTDELGVEYSEKKAEAPKPTYKSAPETPLDLEDIGTKTEDLQLRADGRFPAYIVITSKTALHEQYGPDGLNLVDEAMRAVIAATAAHAHWDSHLVYVDDQDSLSQFDLQPVKASDPWEVKHLLTDLDGALRKKGEMIGAVLIVGGPQVIPFHHLPNPVDDDDKDVPSDNPYASLDENYFVPTWPLGRLPNGDGSDPAMLIRALAKIALSRTKGSTPSASVGSFLARILAFFGLGNPARSSFGYSAEIWQRASHSVYRTIGEPRRLSISPPVGSGLLPKEAGKALQMAYFNLHGLAETAEWYGQRDPQQNSGGPDYPVALRPSDIINSGRAPQVVFTEACFGAHIFNKSVENALALKFLDSGSKAVVGSTVTSYGSVTTPLIAADLLGQTFWKLLNEGHPAGEALRRAKIAMAQTMHRRQGYLDGEDQKTLIAFVLYGDPLAQVVLDLDVPKRILRVESGSPQVKAICDRANGHKISIEQLPEETMATVKSVVADYLPGMQGSQMTYSHEHVDCEGHNCTLPHAHSKAAGLAPTRSLVTLSKKVPSGNVTHPQYARITMDAAGKVVKVAVSR
ncbi:MAG: C25 family cysteine peptidase [Anaerolineales bacterium]